MKHWAAIAFSILAIAGVALAHADGIFNPTASNVGYNDFGNIDSNKAGSVSTLACTYTPVTTGTQNVAYTGATPSASGGVPAYTFSETGSLPTGLSINTSTGVISGTPSVSGTFTGIQVQVADTVPTTVNCGASFTLVIAPGAAVSVITTTGSGSWTVPANFVSLISVEVIGGGQTGSSSGASGGPGAPYSKITSTTTTLTPGVTSISYQVGVATTGPNVLGDTWWNATSLANAVANGATASVAAQNAAAAAGGSSTSVGTTKAAGGLGGALSTQSGGGGGSGGPNGAGAAGGAGSVNGVGGGGGADGGSVGQAGQVAAGGAGGNNFSGVGSGTGATAAAVAGTSSNGGGGGGGFSTTNTAGSPGSTEPVWTSTIVNGSPSVATFGPGSGGGADVGAGTAGGLGGLYGGGGGSRRGALGGQGIIVITYTHS